MTKHRWESKIYDGVHREYYVYLPAQYDPKKPAALMVFQDGYAYVRDDGDFRTAIVFDNHIHQKAIPVTFGPFVNPGHNTSDPPQNIFTSSNRPAECDELNDRYVTFLIEELIPELEKKYALAKETRMSHCWPLLRRNLCFYRGMATT